MRSAPFKYTFSFFDKVMSLSHVYFIALEMKKAKPRNYFASFLEEIYRGKPT